jgi:xylan 1,4-beta-xylosidase
MKVALRLVFVGVFVAAAVCGQSPIQVQVDAVKPMGPLRPIWKYFGYDEPNYTYTDNGKKLIGELAALSHGQPDHGQPVYIRTHFLLATGDGKASLKWGSSNAYTEDAHGKAVYDWTIVDRILDTYLNTGTKPFVEIGFMPKALSRRPDPYNVAWIPGAPNKEYSAGWSYPPKDFAKWGDVVYRWVLHEVEKHGRKEVASWYWEVWNEPDISYWHGTPEEYDELYDYAAAAVKKALPEARVGGPASTGPASQKAAAFLLQFLQHCDQGKNFASGGRGAPLDFITYHAKGQPRIQDGRLLMGIGKHLRDVESGFRLVSAFPRFSKLPIVLSESDPEGCAACSARVYPQNAYRNGALYAVYTAVAMKNILDLASAANANIEGMLTWAFEFEDQPYFDGFRTLATNGIDKPVLNIFRMASKMSGDRLPVASSQSSLLSDLLASGVSGAADVNAIASRGARQVSVLLWNYGDDAASVQPAKVQLKVTGIPDASLSLHRYQIDETHSNAWTAWKKLGSPQKPSSEQYAALHKAGQLEELSPSQSVLARNGVLEIALDLPGEAVTLLQLNW